MVVMPVFGIVVASAAFVHKITVPMVMIIIVPPVVVTVVTHQFHARRRGWREDAAG